MNEVEKLKIEIELLMSLKHVEAWTGSLDELKQNSYVLFSDVIELINDKREKLKNIKTYVGQE